MTFLSASDLTPKERAQYGAAVARDAAFDAVYSLWRRRAAEKWTRKQAADSIAADEGWFSKQFQGPRNWTMETFGALVQALNGDIKIIVQAVEDVTAQSARENNYDAYAEMDDIPPHTGGLKQLKSQPDKNPLPATGGTKRLELEQMSQ